MAITSTLIKSFQLSALTTALALAGCGGGGGNDNLPPPSKGTAGSTSGNGTSNSISDVNITTIKLIDSNGQNVSTINSNGVNAIVKVTDTTGKAISGAMVTYKASGGVTFGTTNGAVLTNANGEASISVKPTDSTDTGAYSLTATATYNGKTATSVAYNFSLQPANVTLSNLTASSTSLPSGGSTNLTLTTFDSNSNTVFNNASINFSTTCGTFTNNSVTSSNQGNVTTTYKAIDANGNLCEGAQTITATNSTGTVSKTIVLNIATIQASSIIYSSIDEVKLVTKNSGSSASGQIQFTVYANGVAAANQQVIISKNYAPDDFSFGTLGNQASQTLTSDSTGKVTVNLYPGVLPGPVELKATLANKPEIYALSKNVSVATGRVTQNGISVSLSKNTLARGVDGDTAIVTMRMVDRVGNTVPDGTVVSFVTEGGKITSNCATVDGVCSVTFTTQNPRPVDDRISVVAYVEGDKQYVDANGNNMFDIGEPLVNNLGGFYRDDNENGKHDFGEYVYNRPLNGSALTCGTSTFNEPNLISQVTSINPLQTITQQCDNQLSAVLRYEFVLGLAGNIPVFVPPFTTLSANPVKDIPIEYWFKMYGNSAQTVSMPAGTTISISTKDNTNYSPTATLTDVKTTQIDPTTGQKTEIISSKRLVISQAEPNSSVKVDIGGTITTVSVNGDGNGSTTVDKSVTSATVIDANLSCTAEFKRGNLTVPAIVDLSNGKVSDQDVLYKFEYKNCQALDEVLITTNTPAPAANTLTTTIKIVK